eukprot:gnl/TRDRNA2_/TRDRNA2_189606_c0_seq1.p1 gnl/TRDRNA2_/TRDRNA2_189606_c0~~gnl/TRDRNA2_/TRDRNA2_189606_c0_seq1.p1  ORF type:complete len:112 (+),score=24.10 gnl/TRDRNA2_/TRDRNA2_189606_c0_seq1:32-337(+)
MLPLGRSKGTLRAAQGSSSGGGLSSLSRPGRRTDSANSQDATMTSQEDAAMGAGPELQGAGGDFLEELDVGPEAEFEALLEKRVHTDYDKDFGDDFDDDDI